MNTTQENELTMFYSVRDVCELYRATWSENAVFAATYALWSGKIPLIETNRDTQVLETTGVTTNKNIKREAMTEKALFVGNRLQSYGYVANDPELLESVAYTDSDMKRARDTEVVGLCHAILERAKKHAAELVSYGATAEIIADLEAAIGAYSEVLAKPKLAKSQTKTATENLAALFAETHKILTKRLDLDIELFKKSAPDFYSQYHTARIVYSMKRKSNSVQGSVALAGSGEPIKGVLFRFTPDGKEQLKSGTAETVKPVEKKSAEKGNFRMKLPEGTYRVAVSKTGYREQELILTIVDGETTYLKVELERA